MRPGVGSTEDDHFAVKRAVAGGIGGSENSSAGFAQRCGQVHGAAIDTDNRRCAAGAVDQTGQTGLVDFSGGASPPTSRARLAGCSPPTSGNPSAFGS